MLDSDTKRRIDTARDILVGKVPDPKSQVEQITIALIYKFMDDMDAESEELGGKRKFFTKDFARYGWAKLMSPGIGGAEMLALYGEGIGKMTENPGLPPLFRDIFKNAYLPYRDPETLKAFLKVIDEFTYDHSERLGDAFEYLLSVLGSQGDAGQFRTPRHIIDFIVEILQPQKNEIVLDPACGTAGFLISAYKYILRANTRSGDSAERRKHSPNQMAALSRDAATLPSSAATGNLLTPDDKGRLAKNFKGYDISPDMVRLSLVNLYLHGFTDPHIYEYDTLTSEERWNEFADVILANPPFMSPKGGIKPHKRFSIQAKRSEVLFVDYMAEHLTPKGRAGIIVPEGIIFQSQDAYKALRKMLVENCLVAVISLPAGCFNPYSGVKTSILILDKTLAKRADSVAFFKVENDGFGLGAQRRAIDKNDLPQVQTELAAYLDALRTAVGRVPPHGGANVGRVPSRGGVCAHGDVDVANAGSGDPAYNGLTTGLIVPKAKLAANGDYNLSGERYRESSCGANHDWPMVELGQIARLINGRAYKQEELLAEGPTPVLRVGNFFSNRGWYYSDLKLEEDKYCNPGDLLFAWSASFGPKIWDGPRAIYHYHIWKVVPTEAVDKMFLFHLLAADSEKIKSEGHGIAMVHATKGGMEKRKFPLPPLEVQREIVAEIEGYQKVINGARAVLDHYRPHIPIHPDWPTIQLGEICAFKNGLNFNKGDSGHTAKIIGVSNFQNHLYAPLNELDEVHLSEQLGDDYLVKEGDILFVRSNGNPDLVGRSLLIPKPTEPTTFSGFTIRGRIHDKRALPVFFAHFFKSRDFAEMIKTVGQGANIRNLSQGILTELKIPLPPLSEQQAIVAEIEAEQRLVAANRELITRFGQKIQSTLARIWGTEEKSCQE
jgi:type I restriction enzyme M protein